MFWDSVVGGLRVLTFWETYVAGLEYVAIFFVPMIIGGIIAEKNEGAGVLAGCLGMLLMPAVRVAAITVLILTLAPIIFGFGEDAAWSFPWKLIALAPGVFFKLVGVLIVAEIILAFIPILGQLHSLQTLVRGGIALMFVLGILDSVNPGIVEGRVDFVPGFWFTVGLIVISGIVSWTGTAIAALISLLISLHMDENRSWIARRVAALVGDSIDLAENGLGRIVVFPLVAILDLMPVFMYGAWLGAQVRGQF